MPPSLQFALLWHCAWARATRYWMLNHYQFMVYFTLPVLTWCSFRQTFPFGVTPSYKPYKNVSGRQVMAGQQKTTYTKSELLRAFRLFQGVNIFHSRTLLVGNFCTSKALNLLQVGNTEVVGRHMYISYCVLCVDASHFNVSTPKSLQAVWWTWTRNTRLWRPMLFRRPQPSQGLHPAWHASETFGEYQSSSFNNYGHISDIHLILPATFHLCSLTTNPTVHLLAFPSQMGSKFRP